MAAALGVCTVALTNKARDPSVTWSKKARAGGIEAQLEGVDEVKPLWSSARRFSNSIFTADRRIIEAKERLSEIYPVIIAQAVAEDETAEEEVEEEVGEAVEEEAEEIASALAEVTAAVEEEPAVAPDTAAAVAPVNLESVVDTEATVIDEDAATVSAAVDAAIETAVAERIITPEPPTAAAA